MSHCTTSVASSNAKRLWTLWRGLKIKLKQYYTKNTIEEKIDWPEDRYSETARPVCRVPEETLELAYSLAAFSARLQTDVLFTVPVLLCFMAKKLLVLVLIRAEYNLPPVLCSGFRCPALENLSL